LSTVVCSRCGQEAQGLAESPLPGQLGELIKNNVCFDCWQEWLAVQVQVINHYGLNVIDPEHRKYLYGIMKEFLGLEEKTQAP
jgi:Fe-S cluster biosynthesis and repair protein YggX